MAAAVNMVAAALSTLVVVASTGVVVVMRKVVVWAGATSRNTGLRVETARRLRNKILMTMETAVGKAATSGMGTITRTPRTFTTMANG